MENSIWNVSLILDYLVRFLPGVCISVFDYYMQITAQIAHLKWAIFQSLI